ncbi:XRE family transcriptional regulator [Pseudomonas sp. NY11955]|uniref:XRE family transcriptional regulator n=1 Tax=Pseudomonas sp. NY11955 TaxID=3400363 RepID=UPI003A8C3DCE
MSILTPPPTLVSLGQWFSRNLSSVLAVAGALRDTQHNADGPGPLSAVHIQQQTGIARSTLRALKSPAQGSDANPDLSTIERLAEALGVPPAFLLMRPQDWALLASAIDNSGDYLAAAHKLEAEERLQAANPVEKVLRECKVHPDHRPNIVGASPEVARANARDEWRRRACLKLDALMLREISKSGPRKWLAAIAGAWVSQTTPHDPSSSEH